MKLINWKMKYWIFNKEIIKLTEVNSDIKNEKSTLKTENDNLWNEINIKKENIII